MKFKANLLFLVFSLQILLAFPPQQAPSTKTPSPKGEFCAPVVLSGILLYLNRSKAEQAQKVKYYPLDGIVKTIDKCGIAFDPTPENLEEIRKFDGSDNVLKAIERAREQLVREGSPPPPVKPTEPQKPKEGKLSVVCKPVDCAVAVDGKPSGRTKAGVLVIGPLPVGNVKVAVSIKDYLSDRDAHTAFIRADEIENVEFRLREDPVALQALGQSLFDRMIESLGGDAGIKDAMRIKASSARLLYARDGKPSQWDLVAWIKLPYQGKFVVTRLKRRYQILKGEAGFTWNPQPKDDGEEVEDALRELYDRQLGRTLERLRVAGLKKIATKLDFGGESPAFKVESGADTYVVTLDSEYHPREVRLENGFMAGLRILYSEYAKAGSLSYPKTTQVLLPATSQQGVELRADNVEFGPLAIKDGDFTAKGRFSVLNRKKK